MKNNAFLKIIVVILIAFSLFALASCTVSSNRMRYAEWTLSDDGETLKCVDVDDEVTKYSLVGMEYSVALVGNLYAYNAYLEGPYGEFLMPYAPAEDSPIVFLSGGHGADNRTPVYVYAEEGAQEALAYAQFLSGQSERYTAYLSDRSKEGVFSVQELAVLRSPVSDPALNVALEVKSLHGKAVAEILAYSDDRRLARVEGAVFEMLGEMYYVDYTALDNSYFDADGNFSFQRGTVTAERLMGEKKETVELVMRRTVNVDVRIALEDGRYVEEAEDTTVEDGAATLVIMTVLVGLCIPLLPIGYVVMYALTEKKRSLALARPSQRLPAPLWVMLAGGVLWFLCALVLVVVFATV